MQTDSATGRGPLAFLRRRWRRQIPLATLFWRDMIVVASIINIVAGAAGLILLGLKLGTAPSLAVLLAPVPYNIFLLASVWPTADLARPVTADAYRLGATLWFLAAVII